MWMLDDVASLHASGVEASWTLKFSIDLGMPTLLINGFFSNGDLLLISNRDWILCDAENLEAEILPLTIQMDGSHYIMDA